jgi:hypothetical protein
MNVCVEFLNLKAGEISKRWFHDYKEAGEFLHNTIENVEVNKIFDTYKLPF